MRPIITLSLLIETTAIYSEHKVSPCTFAADHLYLMSIFVNCFGLRLAKAEVMD
jgi:hypothetical protein